MYRIRSETACVVASTSDDSGGVPANGSLDCNVCGAQRSDLAEIPAAIHYCCGLCLFLHHDLCTRFDDAALNVAYILGHTDEPMGVISHQVRVNQMICD